MAVAKKSFAVHVQGWIKGNERFKIKLILDFFERKVEHFPARL